MRRARQRGRCRHVPRQRDAEHFYMPMAFPLTNARRRLRSRRRLAWRCDRQQCSFSTLPRSAGLLPRPLSLSMCVDGRRLMLGMSSSYGPEVLRADCGSEEGSRG